MDVVSLCAQRRRRCSTEVALMIDVENPQGGPPGHVLAAEEIGQLFIDLRLLLIGTPALSFGTAARSRRGSSRGELGTRPFAR
jgi:hypothetical protein